MKTYQKMAIVPALSLLCFSPIPTTARAETLVIHAYEDNYPVQYRSPVSESGLAGMDVDILKALMERAKLDYRFESYPFKRAQQKAKTGAVHILQNLTRTEGRSEFLDWIGPVRYTAIGLVVQEKDKNLPINNLNDFITLHRDRGLQFAHIIGAKYTGEFDKRIEFDEQFRSAFYNVISEEEAHRMLYAGRIIGFFHDEFEASRQIEENRYKENKYRKRLGDNKIALHDFTIPGTKSGAYFGVSKKLGPQLINSLKASFHQMLTDGTFDRIYKKWIGENPPDEITSKPDPL